MSESGEQKAFVTYVLWKYSNNPEFIRPLFFACPNGAWLGGNNKFALMNKYRAEGWTNGVSDILFLVPRGKYNYFALEMKTTKRAGEKDGGVSEEQIEFLRAAKSVGAYTVIAYGADEAIAAFEIYMSMEVIKHA